MQPGAAPTRTTRATKAAVLVLALAAGWSHPMVRPILMHVRAQILTLTRFAARVPIAAMSPSWPEPCDILLFGSSVAAGRLADSSHGWAQMLADELQPSGRVVIEAIAGSNTWNARLLIKAGLLRWRPKLIILSFTLGNDGLFFTFTDWQARVVADGFLASLPRLVEQAERSGAKVILTSSYPQGRFQLWHVPSLRRVHERTASLRCDGFIDFLTPLDDGHGRWRLDEQADPAHPNSKGHARMLEATRPVVRRVLAELR